jgi:hypothetical protein
MSFRSWRRATGHTAGGRRGCLAGSELKCRSGVRIDTCSSHPELSITQKGVLVNSPGQIYKTIFAAVRRLPDVQVVLSVAKNVHPAARNLLRNYREGSNLRRKRSISLRPALRLMTELERVRARLKPGRPCHKAVTVSRATSIFGDKRR